MDLTSDIPSSSAVTHFRISVRGAKQFVLSPCDLKHFHHIRVLILTFSHLQTPDAHLHHVRALHTDETSFTGVPAAADHSGGVPLHEGPASLQH